MEKTNQSSYLHSSSLLLVSSATGSIRTPSITTVIHSLTIENKESPISLVSPVSPVSPIVIPHLMDSSTKDDIEYNLIRENKVLEKEIDNLMYKWRNNQNTIYRLHLDKINSKDDIEGKEKIKATILKELQHIPYKSSWKYIPAIAYNINCMIFEKHLSEGELNIDDAMYIQYINKLTQKLFPEKFIKVEDVVSDIGSILKVKVFINN